MANERAIRRGAKLALSGLACLLCQGRAVAASDVADAVMHKDPSRLKARIAASTDVNSAQPDGTTFPGRTVPTGNLLLSILNMFDPQAKSFGDSTGRIESI